MLSQYIRRAAQWRDEKAEVFPDDPGNVESAEALRALADFYETIEDDPGGEHFDLVGELEEHIPDGPSKKIGGVRAERALTRYGYGYRVVSEASQIAFLTDLLVACMEDAYDHARHYDEDPTGTLSRVERGAAKFDLALPPDYWRRRRETREDELEAEIDALIQASMTTAS